jgi:hypothetical protein
VNRNLVYVGTELGVYASLDRGTTWFALEANLPTVPVYDLQVHPRDRELIAGTHGRSVQILDVAPLQQMTPETLAKPAHLFAPTVALQYGERPVPSEPRAHRPWRGDRTPAGASITYRLAAPLASAPQLVVLSAAGDTVARLTATNTAGLNTVNWNLMLGGGAGFGQFGGGRGFGATTGPVNDPGFPPGFNPRPAEARGVDSSATPEAVATRLNAAAAAAAAAAANPGQPGRGAAGGTTGPGGFGGQGGFGGARPMPVETGDYRVVLVVGTQQFAQTLRVVRVGPNETSVLVPTKR